MIGRLTDTGRLVLTMARRDRRPTSRSPPLVDEAPIYERPWTPTPLPAVLDAAERAGAEGLARRAADADRLPRPRQQALDLGAVRSPGHGRHGAAARAATPPWCACRTAARRLAMTTDCTPRYCQADPETRRRAGRGRGLAQPHRRRRHAARRHRQHELRQPAAAGDHGPVRRLPSRAWREACRRSTSRSCRATSRSTTRPTARPILPTPAIGGVGVLDDVAKAVGSRFTPGRPCHRADRRDQGLARPVALPARDPRPRGRRAAAGRSRGRAAQRRFRARR